MTRAIPLARPNITQAEIDAVTAVLRTPNLSLGPKLAAFEAAFAQYCGTAEAVACSSGTAALHLLIQARGLGDGDEVITTPFSFVASANCALMAGARPVFVDVDARTWNLDPGRIESAITRHTKAIIAVHVFGAPADMDAIRETAQRHGLFLVEDSCEALGSRYKARAAGSLGDAGVFGFYPNKQITTGEGGMIVTDDADMARLCRSIRNQGRDEDGGWLAHHRLGYNYRISDINCALGIVQLGRLEEIIATRRRVYGWYRDRLAGDSRLRMQEVLPGVEVSWFVLVIRLSEEYGPGERDRIVSGLTDRGIGCSSYFAPIHLQPLYVERYGYREGAFPVCEALATRTIALPFHHELTEHDVDRVCRDLDELMK